MSYNGEMDENKSENCHFEVDLRRFTSRRKASIASKVSQTFREVTKSIKEKKDFLFDFDRYEDERSLEIRYIPEKLETLCAETGIDKEQMRSLYRAFKKECPNGAITEVKFRSIYCQLFPVGGKNDYNFLIQKFHYEISPVPVRGTHFSALMKNGYIDGNAYAHYIFKALDNEQTGTLTFGELVRGLAAVVNGSIQEKLTWIFRLYDIDHDGEISREELSAVIGAVHDLLGPSDVASEQHTDLAFQKFDLNSDGVITMEEFMSCCFKDEIMCNSFAVFDKF